MAVDLMTIVAHPDDAELGAGGTLLRWCSQGASLVMVELTAGQLGTRGTPARRWQETLSAARYLRPLARLCLGWEDGFFSDKHAHLMTLIDLIRRFRPRLVLTNALEDRHPDHGRAAALVERAAFLSGLHKITTHYPPHRPQRILFMIQDRWLMPSFVVDITPFWEQKLQLVAAHRSQFFRTAEDSEPASYLTRPDFFPHLEARAREMGHFIGASYGEGFCLRTPPPIDRFDLLLA